MFNAFVNIFETQLIRKATNVMWSK